MLNSNGSFVYDADDDFFGVDTFTYRAEDSQPSNLATVTLNITPVYDAPRPADDTYKFRPGEAIRVTAQDGVLANDANPDRASLTAVLKDDVASGTLTLQADGSFNYDPQGFAGIASFTYEVDDGSSRSAPVKVDVSITTPPVAIADAYETGEDIVLSVAASGGLLSNDFDAESMPLTVDSWSPVPNTDLCRCNRMARSSTNPLQITLDRTASRISSATVSTTARRLM